MSRVKNRERASGKGCPTSYPADRECVDLVVDHQRRSRRRAASRKLVGRGSRCAARARVAYSQAALSQFILLSVLLLDILANVASDTLAGEGLFAALRRQF